MVDSNAMVLNPCTGLIIPKRIAAWLGVTDAERVGEAKIRDATESRAGFGLKQRVARPGFRIVAILSCRDDIVIAGENQRLLESEQPADMAIQPFQPGQLIGESFRARRVS